MALWSDGSSPTIADLSRHERGIVDVATVESIDLQDKLTLARLEIGTDLIAFLRGQSVPTGVDSELDDVVVTEPLARWVAMFAMSLAYREAHFSSLSERYKGKWEEYTKQAANARAKLYEIGIGRVWSPLPRPGSPTCSVTIGGAPPNTYYLATNWVDSNGSESEASDTAVVILKGSAESFLVSAPVPPGRAPGWNVYVGLTDTPLQRQNADPIDLGSGWALPETGLVSGRVPGAGQPSDYFVRDVKHLWRG